MTTSYSCDRIIKKFDRNHKGVDGEDQARALSEIRRVVKAGIARGEDLSLLSRKAESNGMQVEPAREAA